MRVCEVNEKHGWFLFCFPFKFLAARRLTIETPKYVCSFSLEITIYSLPYSATCFFRHFYLFLLVCLFAFACVFSFLSFIHPFALAVHCFYRSVCRRLFIFLISFSFIFCIFFLIWISLAHRLYYAFAIPSMRASFSHSPLEDNQCENNNNSKRNKFVYSLLWK